MFAGGCAAAGPLSGLSGWKSTSGAVTRAIPPTRSRTGLAPRRGVSATVSPGWPEGWRRAAGRGRARPAEARPGGSGTCGGDGGIRAGRRAARRRRSESFPRLRCARSPRTGRSRRDRPRPPRAAARSQRRASSPRRREPTGPCQSSGTLRTAPAVIVRSEWPTKSTIAPSRPAAAVRTSDANQRSERARE